VCCRTKWKGWSPLEHRLFPVDLRRAVRAMLLCQNRVIVGCEGDSHMTEEGETGELCIYYCISQALSVSWTHYVLSLSTLYPHSLQRI
jgi:hypothetical protein